MPQNTFFLRTRDLLIRPKTTQRHFLFTLHPLSTVIFATATVLAFVLLHNSNFNFRCYTQREATPTQKSARKCAATSRDFFRERLQSAFTLANQLCWIAQYEIKMFEFNKSCAFCHLLNNCLLFLDFFLKPICIEIKSQIKWIYSLPFCVLNSSCWNHPALLPAFCHRLAKGHNIQSFPWFFSIFSSPPTLLPPPPTFIHLLH